MTITIEPLKCSGCQICEFACGFHHDEEFSAIGASLMLYRVEKQDYYGIILKRERDLLLGRPEGIQTMEPGGSGDEDSAAAKPILMRPNCDECEGLETPLCVMACPTGCLKKE